MHISPEFFYRLKNSQLHSDESVRLGLQTFRRLSFHLQAKMVFFTTVDQW